MQAIFRNMSDIFQNSLASFRAGFGTALADTISSILLLVAKSRHFLAECSTIEKIFPNLTHNNRFNKMIFQNISSNEITEKHSSNIIFEMTKNHLFHAILLIDNSFHMFYVKILDFFQLTQTFDQAYYIIASRFKCFLPGIVFIACHVIISMISCYEHQRF